MNDFGFLPSMQFHCTSTSKMSQMLSMASHHIDRRWRWTLLQRWSISIHVLGRKGPPWGWRRRWVKPVAPDDGTMLHSLIKRFGHAGSTRQFRHWQRRVIVYGWRHFSQIFRRWQKTGHVIRIMKWDHSWMRRRRFGMQIASKLLRWNGSHLTLLLVLAMIMSARNGSSVDL